MGSIWMGIYRDKQYNGLQSNNNDQSIFYSHGANSIGKFRFAVTLRLLRILLRFRIKQLGRML